MDSLTGLVALSRGPNPTFDAPTGLSYDYTKTSHSLYLADIIGPMLAVEKMAFKPVNFWGFYTEAYEAMLKQFPGELTGFITGKIKTRFQPYTGIIGETESSGIIMIPGGTAKLYLYTKDMRGGSLNITDMGLLLDANVTDLPIRFYKGEELIATKYFEEILSHSGRLYKLQTPVKLDLDGSDYRIEYDLPNGVHALNNRYSCNCGNRHYALNQVLRKTIGSYRSDQAEGFFMNVTTKCDYTAIVADLTENERFTVQIGQAMMLWAAIWAAKRLKDGNMTPYSALRSEELVKKIAEWNKELGSKATFIGLNFDTAKLPLNRCFTCDNGGIYLGNIGLK